MNKIVVIRLSSLGDVVKTTVLFRHIKNQFKNSKILFITKDIYKDLIDSNPYVDEKIYFKKADSILQDVKNLLNLRKKIIEFRPDIILDAHNNLRSFILTLKAKCEVIKYNKERLKRFLLFYLNINLLKNKTTYEENLVNQMLKKFNISYDQKGSDIFINEIKEKEFQQNLQNLQLKPKSYLTIIPGAQWKNKQVKKEILANLIKLILQDFNNIKIVILGGKKEEALGKFFSSISPSIINLCNKTSLLETIYIGKNSIISIGNDTGITHAIHAYKGKIALFLGPTSKETLAYPFNLKNSIVFEKNIFCRPCSKNGSNPCIWGLFTKRCLNFSPYDIYQKIKPIIKEQIKSC